MKFGEMTCVPRYSAQCRRKKEAETARLLLTAALRNSGYPDEVVKTLKLRFTKAAINPQEVPPGTSHTLADGQPFYRFDLAAQGRTFISTKTDPSVHTLLYMFQALNISFVPGGTPHIQQDFRKPIIMRGVDIANAAVASAPYVLRDLGITPPKSP